MDTQQQSGAHFPGSATPAADAPWGAPAPQHPQSAAPSYPRPFPGHLRGHASVQDAMFLPVNAVGSNRWSDEDREIMRPPVENIAAQGQPQDQRYARMGSYNMVNDHPPLHEHRDHAINNYTGVVLDVPVQAQAPPQAPVDVFGGPARNVAVGPAQAFLDEGVPLNERPPQAVPNWLANEVLRQLAILYVHEPNSQVAMIRMEPGRTYGVRVVIALELADL